MKNLQISILTPYYTPWKGGITSYVSNLATALGKYGINTTVIARYGNTDENVYIANQKIYFILKSYLIICKKRPDVIHAHSNWYTLTPSVIYKILHPKTRLIFTFHTEPISKMKGFKKIAFQWLLSKCDIVTFVSKALMEKIGNNLELTSKKVVYAGVTAKKVRAVEVQQFKEKFLQKNDTLIIAFIGPLVWKQKVEGVKILIKSFKNIKGRFPNAKLLIIGDGAYKHELQQLTENLNIKDNVVFTGFLDNVFVPLSITDIYTHISLQEGGVSLSILEAMGMGKPVIATNIGGIPELIVNNENGVLVEPEPDEIANRILDLYENEEKRERIGYNALSVVKNNFSWEKVAKDFIDIYNKRGET